jgi:hypothetical protein
LLAFYSFSQLFLQEIKTHPFFRDFPWDNILQEEPPFVPDLAGLEDYSRFHVLDPADAAAEAAAAAAAAEAEEEANADSPVLPVIRAPSPDDFVDSPRDFDEAGLTDEGDQL